MAKHVDGLSHLRLWPTVIGPSSPSWTGVYGLSPHVTAMTIGIPDLLVNGFQFTIAPMLASPESYSYEVFGYDRDGEALWSETVGGSIGDSVTIVVPVSTTYTGSIIVDSLLGMTQPFQYTDIQIGYVPEINVVTPEPSSAVMLGVAGIALMVMRRRSVG